MNPDTSSDSDSDSDMVMPITVESTGHVRVKVRVHVMEDFSQILARVSCALGLDPSFKLALRDANDRGRRATRNDTWWLRQRGVLEAYEATTAQDDFGQRLATPEVAQPVGDAEETE